MQQIGCLKDKTQKKLSYLTTLGTGYSANKLMWDNQRGEKNHVYKGIKHDAPILLWYTIT